MPASLRSFTDAAADAIAREIATFRREAQRERDVRDAEYRARLAEFDARMAAVSQLERTLEDRLAALKDGEPGKDGADGRDGVNGADGASITLEDVTPLIQTILADWERPKDGVNGVDGQPGQDGADGVSVTIEDVAPLLKAEAERVSRETAETILATWDKPQDGKSVTVEELAPLVDESVQRAVSALPAPKDGVDGKDGRDGTDGANGKDGERGTDGAPGKLPTVREWEDRVYYEGEVVIRSGSTYQAAKDTGREPPHDDWTCIASAGRDGKDGRSFTIRGTFKDGDEYQSLDIVVLNGASFAARHDNPGPCPGEGWQLIAQQGKQGKPGERGAPGRPGDRGAPGESVVGGTISAEGLLTLANGDGTTVELDLYPVLAKAKQ